MVNTTASPRVRWAITVLAALAGTVAVFLLWESLSGSALPGCGPTSACDAVASSRWSRWGKMPVAGPGAAIYLVMFVGSLLTGPRLSPRLTRLVWSWLVALGLMASGAALWFIGLQFLTIRRICPYCMVDHVAGLVLTGLIVWAAPVWNGEPGESEWRGAWRLVKLTGPAVWGLAVLIAGQILMQPKTHVIIPAASLKMPRPSAVMAPTQTVSQAVGAPASSGRTVSLLEGRVSLRVPDRPILGSPDAPQIIADIFDYTCPSCRQLHGQLEPARARFGDRLAVLPIVMPLAASCNPVVNSTTAAHINSCIYARYALAVWRAAPDKFADFDRWMFASAEVPPVFEARAYAEQLVGGAKPFQAALSDPFIDESIRENIKVYQAAGKTNIPILLFPKVAMVGTMASPEELVGFLAKNLGIDPLPGPSTNSAATAVAPPPGH